MKKLSWTRVAGCLLGCLLPLLLAQKSLAEVDDGRLSLLINQGQLAKAEAELEQSNPTAADRIFFQARVLKAVGDFPRAIAAFREVLSLEPGHVNARRELGHTLLLAGEYEGASYQFSQLLEIEPNVVMQRRYRDFLRVIDLNKPVGYQVFFAVVPSTNVNNGTFNKTFSTGLGQFLIDPRSRANSGVGLSMGMSGYVRKILAPDRRLVFDWQVTGTGYDDRAYNNVNGRAALSFQKSSPRGNWSLAPYVEHDWREVGADERAVGLDFGISRKLAEGLHLDVDLNHEVRRFPDLVYRDDEYTSVSFDLRRSLNPSLWVNAGIEGEISRPKSAHLQYEGYRLFSGVAKSWRGGLFTQLRAEIGKRDFVGDYPLFNGPRGDNFYGINLRVYNGRISYKGFTPQLNCSYLRNHSNVAFNDFAVSECRLGYTKNF